MFVGDVLLLVTCAAVVAFALGWLACAWTRIP
jgi:hypothetical protein